MFVRMFVLSASLLAGQSVYASNYYVGVNLGATSQDPKISVVDNSLDPDIPNVLYTKDYVAPDESTNVASMFVGYRLGQDVALEFGYVKAGEAEGDIRSITGDDPTENLFAAEFSEFSFNYLALTGVWPMGTNWSLNAKLGVASWQYDFRQEVSDFDTSTDPVTITLDGTDSYSDSGSDFFYGLGLGYGINQSLDIRAEFMYIAFDPEFVNVNVEQEMSLFFIGAAYHF